MFVIVVCVLCALLGLIFYLLSCYSSMLMEAHTPWFLAPPVGDALLWLLFHLGAYMRKRFPEFTSRQSLAAGEEKAAALRQAAPAPGAVCFIGSSTFTYWRHLAKDFAPLGVPVFNAGFGGSCTADVLSLVNNLCCDFSPRAVVYFCGTNDLTQGLGAQTALDGFQRFVEQLHAQHPTVPVIYLAATVTPFYRRWNVNGCVATAATLNRQVCTFCASYKRKDLLHFIATDGPSRMEVDLDFLSDPQSFLGDLHHLGDEGHRLLAERVLLPELRRVLKLNQ